MLTTKGTLVKSCRVRELIEFCLDFRWGVDQNEDLILPVPCWGDWLIWVVIYRSSIGSILDKWWFSILPFTHQTIRWWDCDKLTTQSSDFYWFALVIRFNGIDWRWFFLQLSGGADQMLLGQDGPTVVYSAELEVGNGSNYFYLTGSCLHFFEKGLKKVEVSFSECWISDDFTLSRLPIRQQGGETVTIWTSLYYYQREVKQFWKDCYIFFYLNCIFFCTYLNIFHRSHSWASWSRCRILFQAGSE